MAASSTVLSSSFLLHGSLKPISFYWFRIARNEFPSESKQPNPPAAPFLGFKKTAEIWNSRACMIGIIGVFIVEFTLNEGILQVIGVDVGKGLDLPL